METPRHYIHAIRLIPHISSITLRKLLEYFDTPEAIWKASEARLKASGVGDKAAQSILQHRPRIHVSSEWEKLEQSGIRTLLETDSDFPKLLKEIHNPPVFLYARGSYNPNNQPLIAMVGSRHPTPYGERVAEAFAVKLAQTGIGIVSGLAFGVDSIAHKGTLKAFGNTIAVLGNGLDDASLSPRAHLPLAQNILNQKGLLLSEYPPGTQANKFTFPARNRIIAGISRGTVVVEAAKKSGSLITAHYALDFNRDVFAVPGSIFSEASIGPHDLIRSGAKIATGIQDILEELQLKQTSLSQKKPIDLQDLSPEENAILKHLSTDPIHIDKIVKTTTLETSQIQSSMVFLEMKGFAKNIGGMHYIRL